ncbi:rhamnogalacturonan acetylesterase [Armatimonas sp.]|uniref:rhamnogalacturonan acetylesterase n=1 Tax=Armatimonas sp. TaxID=1872638 RepID=UPI00375012A7
MVFYFQGKRHELTHGDAFEMVRGFGFTRPEPPSFAVAVPEGNYDFELNLTGPGEVSVKAEMRRLVLEPTKLAAGESKTVKCTLNVRTPKLPSGELVRLKKDEIGHLDWDELLNLEFLCPPGCLKELCVTPNPKAPTLYVAGDSTVTDQSKAPFAAWGQMLPRFFQPGIAIANHAESGESLKSFVGERRLAKIESTIRKGDYLFIQFTHNDQKPGASFVEPFTTYQEELRRFMAVAQKVGAIPVLVTSMYRRRFDAAGKLINTLGDYPEAMRQLAKAESVVLIDLNAHSKTLFEALGPELSKRAFVHTETIKDDTHFSNYGAWLLAQCVVEALRTSTLPLKHQLAADIRPFDPAKPPAPGSWRLPEAP